MRIIGLEMRVLGACWFTQADKGLNCLQDLLLCLDRITLMKMIVFIGETHGNNHGNNKYYGEN